MSKEVNVLIGKKKKDLEGWEMELFLGSNLKEDGVEWLEYDNVDYPQLLVDQGIFKSKGDAKKNGWNKEIPAGFEDIFIGKLKHRITTYK